MARPSIKYPATRWRVVADHVNARIDQLGMRLEELASMTGPSRSSWSKLANANQTNGRMDPGVLREASIVLGWSPSSIRDILDGGEPTVMSMSAIGRETAEYAGGRDERVETMLSDHERRLQRLEREQQGGVLDRLARIEADAARAGERVPPPSRRSGARRAERA